MDGQDLQAQVRRRRQGRRRAQLAQGQGARLAGEGSEVAQSVAVEGHLWQEAVGCGGVVGGFAGRFLFHDSHAMYMYDMGLRCWIHVSMAGRKENMSRAYAGLHVLPAMGLTAPCKVIWLSNAFDAIAASHDTVSFSVSAASVGERACSRLPPEGKRCCPVHVSCCHSESYRFHMLKHFKCNLHHLVGVFLRHSVNRLRFLEQSQCHFTG